MATEVSIFGQVRGAVRQFFTSPQQDVRPALGDGAEILTCEGLPPLTEIVRQGFSWQALNTTGIAAVTALPTVTAMLTLTNLDAVKSYVIEALGALQVVTDATQSDTTVLLAMLNHKNSAVPSAGAVLANTLVQSLSGKSGYSGQAVLRSGATVVNDGWFPHFCPQSTVPTFAGDNFKVQEATVRGLYIVPPGSSFSMQIMKTAAAAALQHLAYMRWHEVNLNLG
jgi:hypothetical protein